MRLDLAPRSHGLKTTARLCDCFRMLMHRLLLGNYIHKECVTKSQNPSFNVPAA